MNGLIENKKNPKTWGITQQEMNFADEYVMLYFHSPSIYAGMGVDAAKNAGYEIPVDDNKADVL
ncbi:hypothetical protein acsn021_04050 [Anaerocolumna cellulosilytica]|uniref:Uncharacterized protein n=1 Tax=Anaerocolumna cellulosilytica TaxID=433286 RepID=A0A6S6QT59_9FIRM|nr:hypothetical protein [Anaerocolumna cellulosilytica]MBB5197393.1 hypothetical protein [Anaerocolumna cellulosilytica]BCJ92836.1 hypothetical protein acsn021_04050 [Anaerocolumna cellulosilytica]